MHASAQAQTLRRYDDFNGPLLDQTKWVGVNDGGVDIESLEGGMKIQKGKLIFFNRAFGGVGSNTGMQFMQRGLVIMEGSAYDAMETSVQIMSYQITGCDAGSVGSIAYVRIGGYFFNDGTSSGAGDQTGNWFAYINLYRYSNSTDDLAFGGRPPKCIVAKMLHARPVSLLSLAMIFSLTSK